VLHFLQLVYKMYSNLGEIGMQARACCSIADSMPSLPYASGDMLESWDGLCYAVSHTFTAQPPASDEANPAPLVHCQQSFKVQWMLGVAETRA
jgi:hypothetical protein